MKYKKLLETLSANTPTGCFLSFGRWKGLPGTRDTACAVGMYLCEHYGVTPASVAIVEFEGCDGAGNYVCSWCPVVTSRCRIAKQLRGILGKIHGTSSRLSRSKPRFARMNGSDTQSLVQRMRGLNLDPKSFSYDRALGIELECFVPADGKDTAVEKLADALPYWSRTTGDGSIVAPRGFEPVEIRALLDRRNAEPKLFRLCAILKNHRAAVNRSCGFHVHLDQRGEDGATVRKLATKLDKWLASLAELVPQSRRDNTYCKPGISASDRYRRVNFCAFAAKRTLEIRFHSGTVDYTKILSWIRLVELLAAMPKGPRAGGCLATLEQLPLPKHDLAYWRARHQELNPALYSASGAATEIEN